jgi:hypothetical protein
MTLLEVLLAIAIIGVIVTLFSETLFQFAKLKEQGQSEAMDCLSGPQIIAEIQDVLLRIRKCPDPARSVVRREAAVQSSQVAVNDEKQTELLPGLLYGNSEELCVVATDAAGVMPQWTEFCSGNVARSGTSLLSKLSGLRGSVNRTLLQEPVMMEAPRLQKSSEFSGASAEVRIRKLTQSTLELGFEFYDGINWKREWDSVLTQSLPRAIRVTILSRSKKQTNAVSKQHVSTLLLDNPSDE